MRLISTHAPRTGSDNPRNLHRDRSTISTHAPRTGSDVFRAQAAPPARISTHAPRTGSDTLPRVVRQPGRNFNPRSPHGERLVIRSICCAGMQNFNPRSPHGERRGDFVQSAHIGDISTHAPRTGSDLRELHGVLGAYISTHAPRTGSDGRERDGGMLGDVFQPTLPARGATLDFFQRPCFRSISTHAPRTGSDQQPPEPASPPAISTHAPRTGSDTPAAARAARASNFNPRSPHGERQIGPPAQAGRQTFQPTLPARGATAHARKWRTP